MNRELSIAWLGALGALGALGDDRFVCKNGQVMSLCAAPMKLYLHHFIKRNLIRVIM